jgi:predicted ABC-type ATPase
VNGRGGQHRLWHHVAAMIELADSAEVFDHPGSGPRAVAVFAGGGVIGRPKWPAWTPEVLRGRWPSG